MQELSMWRCTITSSGKKSYKMKLKCATSRRMMKLWIFLQKNPSIEKFKGFGQQLNMNRKMKVGVEGKC